MRLKRAKYYRLTYAVISSSGVPTLEDDVPVVVEI